ncbi:F-box only protein 31-like [Diadema setosum]|uniref:F-box only protein 31-like n=1 Tax=Diadema setosum TaxID=31175 RepID=UPI003B3A6384
MDMHTLPPELLIAIFKKLPGKDLASMAMTCRKFRETSLVDSIWLFRCIEEYDVGPNEMEGANIESCRDFYTKVLYPYGHLLGVWQPQMGPYGGLVKIQVMAGVLTASRYLVPPDPKVYLPLGVKKVFTIGLSEEGPVEILCLKGNKGSHKLAIKPSPTTPNKEFTIKCCKPENHKSLRKGRINLHELRVWIQEEEGREEGDLFSHEFDHHVELLRMKYMKLNEFDCTCTYKRLDPPHRIDVMPIQPGLFKGTYGGHGIEMIYFTYEENRLQGLKVTGDPNVPASKMSMEVHLDKPMFLTYEQQHTLQGLIELDLDSVRTAPPSRDGDADVTGDAGTSRAWQPFGLPVEVHDRGMDTLRRQTDIRLDRCTHRYFGTGLIAMPGFRDATRTPAHFIVFSEDILGFLWLELRSLSIYSRVTESMWT